MHCDGSFVETRVKPRGFLCSIFAFVISAFALAGKADAKDVEVVAVYYPHWHRYPKGIEWWGNLWEHGEWCYVKDPVKRFRGHINFKPFVGYLDGAKAEDVEIEIALAHNAGIDVFLYDYYWYNGEITMQESLEQAFLKAKNRDKMKFAIMWCYHDRMKANRKRNHPEGLMKLARTPEEFLGLIDYCIANYFGRPEYWRKNGKLFFSIYNAWDMIRDFGEAGARDALLAAREKVRKAGMGEIEFNGQNFSNAARVKIGEECGFDSVTRYVYSTYQLPKAREAFDRKEPNWLYDFAEVNGPLQENWRMLDEASSMPRIPFVPTGWDVSLRCDKDEPFPWSGTTQDYPYCAIFTNATDAVLEKLLRDAKKVVENDPKKPGAVYINAWNEYTEGCWLLPSDRRGDLRLRAIARVFGRQPANEYVYTTMAEGDTQKGKLCVVEAPAMENVKYGTHERQGMDIWFPRNRVNGGKMPAVVYFHAGDLRSGDRMLTDGWVEKCLDAGVAFITVGYRFLQDADDDNVKPTTKAPFDDAVAAVRFVQANADKWDVDVTRIGLVGSAAGASLSLSAALQDDSLLGVRAIFAEAPQEFQSISDLLQNCTMAKAPILFLGNRNGKDVCTESIGGLSRPLTFGDKCSEILVKRGISLRCADRDMFLQELKRCVALPPKKL